VKILVTGAAGFIGSHVVDAFVAAGHEVVGLDNLSNGKREQVHPRARFVELDITDPCLPDFVAAERFDVIDHHAAQVSVVASVGAPIHDAATNILGSINLLEAAVRGGVGKFIYISSGGAMYGDPTTNPVSEDHPARPLSPYGVSKHTVEQYVRLYAAIHGLAHTTLRYANVYGPRQDPHGEAGVIAIFCDRLLRDEPVTLYGDGEMTRDFLYVGDCVAANLAALERGDGGAYNLGWGVGVPVERLYAELRALTGATAEPAYAPARPGEIRHIALDASRAAAELGWRPTVPIADGLALTIDSHRSGRFGAGGRRAA
jgi:UDP-glucose 4-epimerase